MTLPTIQINADDSSLRLRCDVLVANPIYHDELGDCLALSVAASSSAVKAVAAVLRLRNKSMTFDTSAIKDEESNRSLMKRCRIDGNDYELSRHWLGYDTWHLVAVSRDPWLILGDDDNDNALWRKLTGNAFTTPLLRPWVGWIKQRMIADGRLRPLISYGVSGRYLWANDVYLDKIVSEGVKGRELSIR